MDLQEYIINTLTTIPILELYQDDNNLLQQEI